MVLGICCSGGFAGVTYELANELNSFMHRWDEILYIEELRDWNSKNIKMLNLEEFTKSYSTKDAEIVIAAGEPALRGELYKDVKAAGYSMPNLIHPLANAKKFKSIGEGNIILCFSYISSSEVELGSNNIVMPFSQISHDSIIGNHCVVASSACLSGTTVLKDRVYIGTGAKLRENITIGYDAVVGMGAIVVKNVDDQSVVVGLPAKEIRKNTGKVFKRK